MLTRIFADNFRALVNFELRPARLTLLLGENGSGKTSLLEVLGNLRDLVVLGRTSTELFSYTRTKWETRDVQRFELAFQAGGGTYRYALEIQHAQGLQERPFIRSESVSFDSEPLYRYSEGEVHLYYEDDTEGPVFPFRSDQSFLANLDSVRTPRMGRLVDFKELVEGLWIVQPNPFDIDLVSKQDQSFLARRGKNFASFFEHLNAERPDVRAALEEHLREALPGFRNFLFKRLWDGRLLLATFGDEKHKAEYGLGELSEGQRVLLMLYAAVFGHLRSGSLLCFDEPDNFVSLPEIQPWLQTLRDELAEQGGQALIISHHPEVIDYLALDLILKFERPSGPVIVRPLEIEEVSDLRLSDIIARGA
jgi:ATPase subunit of ABC transporter with duplicated ATPase domains